MSSGQGCSRWLGIVALLLGAEAALAQSYTVRTINRVPQFGDVAAAQSGTTVFENSNAFITVRSGSGRPIKGPVRQGLVTIRCQNAGVPSGCADPGSFARIRIGSLSATGRSEPLTEFTASSGTGIITSGTTTGPALDFSLTGWTGQGNLNFTLDTVMPVLGDNASSDTSGLAYFYVYADKAPLDPTVGLVDAAMVNVRRSLHLTKISELRFGAIVKNAEGTGQVTIDAYNDGVRTFGGSYPPTGLPSPDYGRALLSLTGEPNTQLAVSFSPSNSLQMSDGSTNLSVSLEKSASGNVVLPATGQLDIGVGGTITVPKGKQPGVYQGVLTVSTSYN